jgi:BirA family biotin operon repressor/biotin-[acetyl-CoA-carboxylase] ligase
MSELIPKILRFDSLPSTNLEAARRAIAGAPEGFCIVAGEQTAGRGRHQRHWVSPKDAGLYFSIILRPSFEQNVWPLLTLMTAIAVHDALLEVCSLHADIKWPNDILVNEKKLCGILAETVETPLGRAVIVGVGINLTSQAFPPELNEMAASIESETGRQPAVDAVLEALSRFFRIHYGVLQLAGGAGVIVDRWSSRSSYALGKRIRVSENEESFSGITRGLEPDGALRVETDKGEIRIVRAGDVTAVRAVSI